MTKNKDIALVFLVTEKEFKSLEIKNAIHNLFIEYPPSLKSSFSIYFIFNNFFPINYLEIEELLPAKFFHKIKIHFLKIDSKDDAYISRGKQEAKSNLGLSAGPNSLFFGALNYMKNKPYKYFLLLESDVVALKYYWLDKIVSFARQKDFLIAGSKYKGVNPTCRATGWQHINGVAIYKNNKLLHELINSVKIYLINYIAKKRKKANQIGQASWEVINKPSEIKNWFNKQNNNKKRNSLIMNYDVAIYKYCKEIGPDFFSFKNTPNRIMDTEIIIDLSLHMDKKTKIEDVKNQFPAALLCHKKIDE